MNPDTAVLLLAYGGPNSIEDVEPFLFDVRGGRATSSDLIEEIRNRYIQIGGKSPLLENTLKQANELEKLLNEDSKVLYQVFVGMRHWHPFIKEIVSTIADLGITNIIAICMTPFSSQMSTDAYYKQLNLAIEAQEDHLDWQQGLSVKKIGAWYCHWTFIRALAENVKDSLKAANDENYSFDSILFTAHSLPVKLSQQGDPYAHQFNQLSRLVAEAAGLEKEQWRICFQSAGAQNTRWLGPSLEETIQQLASEGQQNILVAPIGFISDHVEILYDIDLEAKHLAENLGINLVRIKTLNDQPLFIKALSEIILNWENFDDSTLKPPTT